MLIAIVGQEGCGKTTFRKQLLENAVPEYNPNLPTHVLSSNWNWSYKRRRIAANIAIINHNLIIESPEIYFIPSDIWSSVDRWIFLDGDAAETYFKRVSKFTPQNKRYIEGLFGVWILENGDWEYKCSYMHPCMIYNGKKSEILRMYDCIIKSV